MGIININTMSGAEIIISLTYLILIIILIVKFWRMTHDIKKIAKVQTDMKSNQARVAYLRGDKELAQRLLDEHFFEMAREYATSDKAFDFNKNYDGLVSACTELYKKMDLKAPDFEKYKNKEELIISAYK